MDIEDIRYLNEAGEAVKSGFGGFVAYFPASDSQKQMETITISGSVAAGDEFFFNVREQTAMLETESETLFDLSRIMQPKMQEIHRKSSGIHL